MSRRSHSDTTRARVLILLESGMKAPEVARELGIPEGTVYCWAKEERDGLGRQSLIAPKVRPKTHSGSGVIAPAPYATRLLYPGGRGRYAE